MHCHFQVCTCMCVFVCVSVRSTMQKGLFMGWPGTIPVNELANPQSNPEPEPDNWVGVGADLVIKESLV